MAKSSKRQRVRGSYSTAVGRRRRQLSPPESSPSPPPSPTPTHQNLQFSTPALAERYFSLFNDRQIIDPKHLDDQYFEDHSFEFFGMLKNMGLDDFVCDVARYYPNLATEEDIMLMWIIMMAKQINWTHLIRHRMKKALRPGGVIQSFGLTRNADNRWVHRNSPPPPQRQNQAPPQLQPPPPLVQQQTTSFDDVMREINDLRTFVGDNFNTLNESMNARFEQLELNMGDRFDTIDARVEHVEHDIDYLRRHFGPHGGSSS
ncbi:hypothetical protein LR48_Vigan511s009700 [Vigna angularis]|uniref:Uncharacterized protein n=1 Tax=Phaseolus angularis TaxID=3914 RepID=A0A0L9TDN5_PHAAN|nr:hypothetical protein LR48_Vigan511s009700 [Vigna angularis]